MHTMNESSEKKKNLLISLGILAAVAVILSIVIPDALSMRQPDVIKKGAGVTQVMKLSEYFDGIAGTRGDTDIYVLDSGKPGASALILGGTHPNEPSGYLSAVLFVENAMPSSGKLFVIPATNASAMTHTDYMEGTPRKFSLETWLICAVQAENQRRYLPQCSHWRGVRAADVRRIRLHQHRNDAAACALCAEAL